MKNSYQIIEFENPKGFGYFFNVNIQCRYTLLFNHLGENKYIFEFEKSASFGKETINYQLVRDSICNVILNFIKESPERVIFVVYENEDHFDTVRFRLFNSWFNCYNKSNKFLKFDINTKNDEIVSIILMSNNIKFINKFYMKD